MQFLNPIFLIGMTSALIPLIIHLSRSRRTKKIRFSTTRFMTDHFLRSYRMSRIKELLLLLARMLLFALFAAALAQPFVQPQGQAFAGVHEKRTVVFVIDNSASMGYIEHDVSLLQRARAAAIEIVDSLKEGDRASVILAGHLANGPEILFNEPTLQLGDVRQAVEGLQVTGLETSLTQAILLAEQMVKSAASDESREIYVLSDLQGTGWEVLDEEQAGDRSDANIFFVSVRPEHPRNIAITAVQYAAARPMVGIPFAIRPHVRNHNNPATECTVELYIDDRKVGEQRITGLRSGRWSVTTFHHTFESGGWHAGYVQTSDGTLAGDDRRYFAFQVLDAINVLAVNGAPSSVRWLDELFFVEAALGAGMAGQNAVDVEVVDADALINANLDDFSLVILANVETLASQAVETIERYVDSGGSLLIFLGDKSNPSFYNRTLNGSNRLHGGLMPGPLQSIQGDPADDSGADRIGEFDGRHVVLAAFETETSLDSVTMKAFWKIDPGDATVLMRTATGSPLLCERPFGKGQVMVFASTCDRDWTNFPVRPAFLPWMYRVVGYLSQERMGRQNFYHTGDVIPVPVSATTGLTQLLVKKPDGTVGSVGTTGDSSAPLAFVDTTQAGAYTMYAPDGAVPEQVFVCNVAAFESDLTLIDDVLADRALPESATREAAIVAGLRDIVMPGRPLVSFVGDPAEIAQASLLARGGWKLWNIILMIVIAVALIEPWIANLISLKHYSKPREIQQPTMGGGRRVPTVERPTVST